MVAILTDWGDFTIAASDGLRVSPMDAETITGWTLKPEGMCRDELCVPLTGDARRDGRVDLAAFWRALGHPVVSDQPGDVWVLGTAAESRVTALAGARGAGLHIAGSRRNATSPLRTSRQKGVPHDLGILVRLSP